MSLLKFIFSKTFLIQLGLAIVALVLLAFLTMQWLEYSTNQDERIKVPNLAKLAKRLANGLSSTAYAKRHECQAEAEKN